MSIPEIATLMFIISLWLLSIFCCIKRYEKISTIERADLPQYRKNDLLGVNSPEMSSSPSGAKSPVSLVATPPGPNSPVMAMPLGTVKIAPPVVTTTIAPATPGSLSSMPGIPTATTMYSSSSRLLGRGAGPSRASLDFVNYGGAGPLRSAGDQTLVRMFATYGSAREDSTDTTSQQLRQYRLQQQPSVTTMPAPSTTLASPQFYYEMMTNEERAAAARAGYLKNQNFRPQNRSSGKLRSYCASNRLQTSGNRGGDGWTQKQLIMQNSMSASNPPPSSASRTRGSIGSIPYAHFKNVIFVIHYLQKRNYKKGKPEIQTKIKKNQKVGNPNKKQFLFGLST
jgi:hypothetical protein